jgi:2-polyprenyl-3-methyl-5-hydroxy-6-metoxy-1,4-benzoquinol methylase
MASSGADTPWWTLRFEQLCALDPALSGVIDERAELEVEFVEKLAGMAPGARVLDVGCGGGRHSILFAERGHQVTGVDLSPRILRVARERWEERNPDKKGPTWMPGDMRWLPASPPADVAVILDGGFGMFEDDAEHLRVLGSVADLMRPGGKVVIQTLNPYHWSGRARAIHTPPGILSDEIEVIQSHKFDAMRGRVEERIVVFKGGQRHEPPPQTLRAWTPVELLSLLRASGLHQPKVYGSEGWAVPEEPLPVHPTESVWLWAVATA